MGGLNSLPTKFMPKPKNFNVLNRAHKEIGKEKGRSPPTHKTYAEALRRFTADNPEASEYAKQNTVNKNEQLSKNLNAVFVKSKGDNPIFPEPPAGSMPSLDKRFDRQSRKEAIVVPTGRLDVSMMLKLLHDYGDGHPATTLAAKYKISIDDVQILVKYCKLFYMIGDRADFEPYKPEMEVSMFDYDQGKYPPPHKFKNVLGTVKPNKMTDVAESPQT